MSIHFETYKDFICIFGRKAMGKSKFARFIIKSLTHFIIWDRHHEYGDCGYCVFYADRILQAWKEGFTQIVYQPQRYTDIEFDEVCKVVSTMSNLTFIVEEVDEHAHAHGYSSPIFQRIVRGGRHQGIGLILISRRPAITHKDLRSNADYVIVFNMHELDDVKYIASWIGLDDYEKIRQLPEWHSLLFNAETHQVIPQLPCPYF